MSLPEVTILNREIVKMKLDTGSEGSGLQLTRWHHELDLREKSLSNLISQSRGLSRCGRDRSWRGKDIREQKVLHAGEERAPHGDRGGDNLFTSGGAFRAQAGGEENQEGSVRVHVQRQQTKDGVPR